MMIDVDEHFVRTREETTSHMISHDVLSVRFEILIDGDGRHPCVLCGAVSCCILCTYRSRGHTDDDAYFSDISNVTNEEVFAKEIVTRRRRFLQLQLHSLTV